ncbi:MAG: rod-binding protein [bacterium]|nr:rod-binding protein [bacterium]
MSTINTSWNPTAPALLSRPSRVPEFRSTLEGTQSEDVEVKREEARAAAEGLVATSFIKPILSQIRESNNAPPPFGPTQAEKQFGSLLDNQLADEIARAAQFPIVDRLVEQFTRHLPPREPSAQSLDLSA